MDDSFANVTAVAGGGQSALPTITATNTRLAVVVTAGDSVTLPRAAPGLRYKIKNATANSANVFPSGTTDAVNALSAAAAFALASHTSAEFVCMVAGTWDTFPTAAS